MAAGNGFLTVSPDERYGNSVSTFLATDCWARRFTCGGTGTQEILEIGVWIEDAGSSFVMAIYTDDAVNGCPASQVANSVSGVMTTEEDQAQEKYVYVTKPQVTGGQVYWICGLSNGAYRISRFDTGGTGLYKASVTYDTWPVDDEWHTHNDVTRDWAGYAVYQALSAGGSVPVIAGNLNRRRRV